MSGEIYAQDFHFETVRLQGDSARSYYLGIIQNNSQDNIIALYYSDKYSLNIDSLNLISEIDMEAQHAKIVTLNYYYNEIAHERGRIDFILPYQSRSFKFSVLKDDKQLYSEFTFRQVPISLLSKLYKDYPNAEAKTRKLISQFFLRNLIFAINH